jgi:hypothetical protein
MELFQNIRRNAATIDMVIHDPATPTTPNAPSKPFSSTDFQSVPRSPHPNAPERTLQALQ